MSSTWMPAQTEPTTCRLRADALEHTNARGSPPGPRPRRRPGGAVPERRLVGCLTDGPPPWARPVRPQADLVGDGLDRPGDPGPRASRGVRRGKRDPNRSL